MGTERTVMFTMPAAAQGRLLGFEGSVRGRSFALSTGTFVIGRSESCDLPLTDPGVSRQHAKIVAEGEAYILLDTESRNGTFVNGKPVRRATLREGDEVRICAAALRFTVSGGGGGGVPAEFDSAGDTNPEQLALHGEGPTDPYRPPASLVPTVSGLRPGQPTGAPAAPPLASAEMRTLKLVLIVALAAALLAVSAAIGVVISVQRKNSATVARLPTGTADASGGSGTARPVGAVDAGAVGPVGEPGAIAVAAVIVDAGVAGGAPEPPPPTAPAAEVVDAGVAGEGTVAVAPGIHEERRPSKKPPPERDRTPKPPPPPPPDPPESEPGEWLPARTGPELVRAPAAGPLASLEESAVAGKAVLVVGSAPPVKAPATGPVTPRVRVGDAVRKGQVIAGIADPRARIDVGEKRVKKGAKLQLQLGDGSVRPGTVDEVVGGTIFVVVPVGSSLKAVRFR